MTPTRHYLHAHSRFHHEQCVPSSTEPMGLMGNESLRSYGWCVRAECSAAWSTHEKTGDDPVKKKKAAEWLLGITSPLSLAVSSHTQQDQT